MNHQHPVDAEPRCDTCMTWPDWWLDLAIRIDNLGVAMTEAQNDIDADTTIIQGLASSLDTIESGIDALKAGTDGTVDTSALDAAIADLKTKVGAAVTDVTPAAPVDTTPPVDAAPVDPAPVDPAPTDDAPAA